MRKLIILFISTIILFNLSGYGLVYTIKIYKNYFDIRLLLEKMQQKKMTTLRFSIAEYEKLRFEKENEFEFKGNMFDIKKTYFTRDSVTVICYMDKYEKILKNSFAKNHNNKPRLDFFKFGAPLFFEHTTENNYTFIRYRFYSIHYFFNTPKFYLHRINPPPENQDIKST